MEKYPIKTILISAVVLFLFAFAVRSADVSVSETSEQKAAELEKVRNKVKEKLEEAAEYKKKKEELEQYLESVRLQDDSFNKDVQDIHTNLSVAKSKLDSVSLEGIANERAVENLSYIFASDIKDYFFKRMSFSKHYGFNNVVKTALWNSVIYRDIIMMERLKGAEQKSKEDVRMWNARSRELTEQSKKMADVRKEREEVFLTGLADLKYASEKYERAVKEIRELEGFSRELNAVLEELERKKEEEEARSVTERESAPAVIAHGSLMWPVNGRVVSKFGKERAAGLDTLVRRDGIKIQTAPNSPIRAVSDGKVIYAGLFRSYGRVVIVEHQKGFFSIYGLLEKFSVSAGRSVRAGEVLGYCGKAKEVYFEMRVGTRPVDPLQWLTAK